MNKFILLFGTRPELIKLAPIIAEFQKRKLRDRLFIVNTNQHQELVKQELDYFHIDVDYQFELNRNSDSLTELHALLLLEFYKMNLKLSKLKTGIDSVITQGDTCTSFCAAQYSFYEKIPLIHIEAGLRTHDFNQPFPEEYYRKTISSLAKTHFAPTPTAKENLISEKILPDNIHVTGNTVIDNLRKYFEDLQLEYPDIIKDGLILITIHRRENRLYNIGSIIDRIVFYCEKHPEKSFLWLAHPAFNVESHFKKQPPNLKIIQPVSFSHLIDIYRKTSLIITDSGGIQEESCYLGIPVLIFRTKTERTEAINSGIAKYVDNDDNDLDLVISNLNGKRKTDFNTIYGDGFASKRIVDFLVEK